MKVDLQINILTKALKTLSKIKSDVLIDAIGDIVTLIKTDKDTTLKACITDFSYENGRCLVSNETAELIKKMKDGPLTLSDREIKTDNKIIRFEQISIEAIPEEPIWEETFRTTEKELHRMLEVKYAIAKDETRPILCGVYFNKNETCALDGYRLSVRKGNYDSDKSFVVNKNTIEVLDSILDVGLDREVVVYYGEEKIKFEIGSDLEVIGDTIQGEFIKYKLIIPEDHNYISKVNLDALKDELNFLSSIKTNYMKLNFKKDTLTINTNQCKEELDEAASDLRTRELQISAHYDYEEKYNKWVEQKAKAESKKKPFKTRCPEEKRIRPQKVYMLVPIAQITSEVDCNSKFLIGGHDDFNIGVNYKYLNDSLKTYSADVEFRMCTRISPIIITNDGENLELLLPIRVKGD